MFRRDRQYFDYDLLGNPNIPGGQTISTGPANAPTDRLRGRRLSNRHSSTTLCGA